MITALLLAATVHAATITDSWLGKSSAPVPAGTQFLSGTTIYVHVRLKLLPAGNVTAKWYRNGKLVKTSTISGSRVNGYSTVSISSLPGTWTVVLTDTRKGYRRSHHFVVK